MRFHPINYWLSVARILDYTQQSVLSQRTWLSRTTAPRLLLGREFPRSVVVLRSTKGGSGDILASRIQHLASNAMLPWSSSRYVYPSASSAPAPRSPLWCAACGVQAGTPMRISFFRFNLYCPRLVSRQTTSLKPHPFPPNKPILPYTHHR